MQSNPAHTLQTLYWKYVKNEYLVLQEGGKVELRAWRYFITDQKAQGLTFKIEGHKLGVILPRNFNITNN